jgi:hypothetical protein
MKTLRNSLFPLLWLSAALLLNAAAQTKRSLTTEDLVALNRASDVQLAVDGRRAAFVVTSWDRAADRFNALDGDGGCGRLGATADLQRAP